MREEILITTRANPKIDPNVAAWGWQVIADLFLVGLTAGALIFTALVILGRKEETFGFTAKRLPLIGLISIGLAMMFLFLKLTHKIVFWRFFGAFVPTAVMSWGAWLLQLVIVAILLLTLQGLRGGYPALARPVDKFRIGTWALDWAEQHRRAIAWASVVLGVIIAFYTGSLMTSMDARPFASSGLMAPLFLTSGLATAAAVILIGSGVQAERQLFARVLFGTVVFKTFLLALTLANLANGSQVQMESVQMVFGGEYTRLFWLFFVIPGLLVPLAIEAFGLRGKRASWMMISPVLVLYGAYMLRQLVVDIGQVSGYLDYVNTYNPALLDLLR
ncbi:MAG: polysulfide reductase [Wenzhouxiangella sp.]|nr:MAG: polysulfide reductase [Wenzhouxiangella sp.]